MNPSPFTPQPTRILAYTSESPRDVTDLMTRLEAAFVKEHKRKMAVELFFSSWNLTPQGEARARPVYGMTVYAKEGQEAESDWVLKAAQSQSSL